MIMIDNYIIKGSGIFSKTGSGSLIMHQIIEYSLGVFIPLYQVVVLSERKQPG